jgi:hypothetical protein
MKRNTLPVAQNMRIESWSRLNKIQKKITVSSEYRVILFLSKVRAQTCVSPAIASGLISQTTVEFTRDMTDSGQWFKGGFQVVPKMPEKLGRVHC